MPSDHTVNDWATATELYLHGGFNLQVEFDNLLIANPDRHVTGRRHLRANYGEREGSQANSERERTSRSNVHKEKSLAGVGITYSFLTKRPPPAPLVSQLRRVGEVVLDEERNFLCLEFCHVFSLQPRLPEFAVRRENSVYYSMFKIAVTELFGNDC